MIGKIGEKKFGWKVSFFNINCHHIPPYYKVKTNDVYIASNHIQERKKTSSTVSDWRTWNPDSWQDAHVEVFSEGGTQLINEIRRLGNLSFLNAYTFYNQIENLPKHTHHLHP